MPTHFGGRRRLLSDGEGHGPLAGRRRRGGHAHRDGECLNSTLHVNGASLDTTLPPGEYKLWVSSMLGPAGLLLEEQEPPGGGCIPVSLAVSVSYEDPQPSPSTCAGRTVPASFDEAGYMSNGRMHVQAQYSVYSVSAERRHAISLTVSKESVIRVHVQGRSHVDMRLALFRDEGAGKAFMIDSEAPLVSDGVRGDALCELTFPCRISQAQIKSGRWQPCLLVLANPFTKRAQHLYADFAIPRSWLAPSLTQTRCSVRCSGQD